MSEKIVILFLLVFLPMITGVAAEVALVTELSGTVTASSTDDRWNVSLAEILDAGVELRVASDSSMAFIHMLANDEYRLASGAVVSLDVAGATGSGFERQSLQIVSANPDLGADSQNQAGTTHVDRVVPPSAPASSSGPGNSRDSRDASSSLAREQKSGAFKFDMTPARIGDDFSDDEDMVMNSELLSESGNEQEQAAVVLTFALPMELSGKESFAEPVKKIEAAEFESFSAESSEGWVSLTVFLASAAAEVEVTVHGKTGKLVFKAQTGTGNTFIDAWKLEKAGYLQQSAAIWLDGKKSGIIAAEKADVHLRRLRQKMSIR
jgi:hypothetical protein